MRRRLVLICAFVVASALGLIALVLRPDPNARWTTTTREGK